MGTNRGYHMNPDLVGDSRHLAGVCDHAPAGL